MSDRSDTVGHPPGMKKKTYELTFRSFTVKRDRTEVVLGCFRADLTLVDMGNLEGFKLGDFMTEEGSSKLFRVTVEEIPWPEEFDRT